jgi:hypothetical protein
MHVCDEFRERITERILDHIDLDHDVETQREMLVCSDCADFYAESREVVDALAAVHFDIAETQWELMADRMRVRIQEDYASRHRPAWTRWFYVPAFAAALVLLLVVAMVHQKSTSPESGGVAGTAGVVSALPIPINDPSVDPVTAEYLEESELLLRSVMKLKPSAVEDVAEARRIADRQLVALDQRKQAVSEVKPLVTVMNKYETVLRDIRNLDRRPHADDISDIKTRIEKNGLISNMTAFQPRPAGIDVSNGMEK